MFTDKLLLNFGRVECPSENNADKSFAFHEHHCLLFVLLMFVVLPKENTIMEFIIYGKGIKEDAFRIKMVIYVFTQFQKGN